MCVATNNFIFAITLFAGLQFTVLAQTTTPATQNTGVNKTQSTEYNCKQTTMTPANTQNTKTQQTHSTQTEEVKSNTQNTPTTTPPRTKTRQDSMHHEQHSKTDIKTNDGKTTKTSQYKKHDAVLVKVSVH